MDLNSQSETDKFTQGNSLIPEQAAPSSATQTLHPQFTQPVLRNRKKLIALCSIIILFIFSLLGVIALLYSRNTAKSSQASLLPAPTSIVNKNDHGARIPIVILGYKDEVATHITTLTTDSSTEDVMTLPSNVKKVKILSSKKIIAIGDTDQYDHGDAITEFETGKDAKKIILADPGYGIDDYVISKNERYLVDWEVKLGANNILLGGYSRVNAIDLKNPTKKYLLYDETAISSTPIHYPLAVTKYGKVLIDTYIPNSGLGWAYGMSSIQFDGSGKTDIPSMVNGTYATHPLLSPDEKTLAFVGYDGKYGDGKETVENIRKAIAYANTIELLDISTSQRRVLPNLPDTNLYSSLRWDTSGESVLIFNQEDITDASTIKPFAYSIGSGTEDLISPDNSLFTHALYVTSIDASHYVLGIIKDGIDNVGNLGDRYASPYTSLGVYNKKNHSLTAMQVNSSLPAEYIQTVFEQTGSRVLAASTAPLTPVLQEKTFGFAIPITPIAPQRQVQQSAPVVPPAAKAPPPAAKAPPAGLPRFERERYEGPHVEWDPLDSPLYLYGPEGTKVEVTIGTQISHAVPMSDGVFNVTLSRNGTMISGGAEYGSISYAFVPRINLYHPTYGTVVSSENRMMTIKWYAESLGLNEKETADLLEYADKNLHAAFTFVSFYDETTSEHILPLSISPRPEQYQNIVFYFEDLQTMPLLLPRFPQFPKITSRLGFSAIEVSEYHK